MTRLEASMKDLALDELHDIIIESLYIAAAWHDKTKRDVAYHAGIAATKELLKRAEAVTKETK